MCTCDPPSQDGYTYIGWIGEYFASCVYTPLETASFSFGLATVGFLIISLFPQMIKNIRFKRVDGLSPFFLMLLILGDMSHLLGAVFTHQLPVALYTAVFICALDVLLMLQFAYYMLRYKEKAGEDRPLLWDEHHPSSVRKKKKKGMFYSFWMILIFGGFLFWKETIWTNKSITTGRLLLEDTPCYSQLILQPWEQIAGIILAATANGLHIIARIPQIYRNYSKKSVEGLASGLFFCVMIACGCYILSVALSNVIINEEFWRSTLPYLIGCAFVFIENCFLLGQIALYRWRSGKKGIN